MSEIRRKRTSKNQVRCCNGDAVMLLSAQDHFEIAEEVLKDFLLDLVRKLDERSSKIPGCAVEGVCSNYDAPHDGGEVLEVRWW
jgi:hypothetical protein